MLAETITYTDYNDEERTETYYFNLSKAELIEMEVGTTGGLSSILEKIISAKDVPALSKMFKDLILKSYGVKSPDGRRFIKSEELSTEFSQTPAYSQLYVDLALDSEKAARFVNGIFPRDLVDQISKDDRLKKLLADRQNSALESK